jgi:hypothetical protein
MSRALAASSTLLLRMPRPVETPITVSPPTMPAPSRAPIMAATSAPARSNPALCGCHLRGRGLPPAYEDHPLGKQRTGRGGASLLQKKLPPRSVVRVYRRALCILSPPLMHSRAAELQRVHRTRRVPAWADTLRTARRSRVESVPEWCTLKRGELDARIAPKRRGSFGGVHQNVRQIAYLNFFSACK